jgi:hypothetical protein
MKKKFDFSAEIESAKARTKQEYREPESTSDIVQLLDNIVYNLKDLSSLNHTVIQLRRTRKNFLETVPLVSDHAKEQAIKEGQAEATQNLTLATNHLVECIDAKCKEAEKRIRDIDDHIVISTTTFYIALVCLLALFSFFLCVLFLNIEFLQSPLIWKCLGMGIGIVVLGIIIAIYATRWIESLQKK